MITIQRDFNPLARVEPEALRGTSFNSEQGAHTFVIRRMENGVESPFQSGTAVTGKFLCATGGSYELSGSVEDGRAVLTLIPACYAVTGRFLLTIMATSGDDHTVIYAAVGSVTDTTGTGSVVPGGTVPDYAALIAEMEAVRATIPEDYTDTVEDVNQINGLLNLVDYGQDNTLRDTTTDGMTVTRQNNRITIDGTNTNGSAVYFRLYSAISVKRGGVPAASANITGGLTLKAGHTYRAMARLVSGSYTKVATGHLLFLIYIAGTTTAINTSAGATYSYPSDSGVTLEIPAQAEDTEVCPWIMVGSHDVFDNATWEITVEDTTNGAAVLPMIPEADGTYTLQVTVTDGKAVYAWVAASGTASLLSSPLSMTAPDAAMTDTEEGDTE